MLVRRDPFMSLSQISGEINNEVSSRTNRWGLHGSNLPGRMARKDNIILMLVKRNPFMSLRQIFDKINNEVSSRTNRRGLHGANIPGRIASRLPLLRPHHLRSSLQFDKSHISWKGSTEEKKWRNIL